MKRLREKLEGVSDKWSLKTVWGGISLSFEYRGFIMQSLYKKDPDNGRHIVASFFAGCRHDVATYNHFVAKRSRSSDHSGGCRKADKAYSLTGNLETDGICRLLFPCRPRFWLYHHLR